MRLSCWRCLWTFYYLLKNGISINSQLQSQARYFSSFIFLISQWSLLLLTSPNPDHVIHGVKILARLLVTQGPVYVSKFASRMHGFLILRHHLAACWEMTPIWPSLLAILFGVDVVSLKDFSTDQPLRLFDLLNLVKLGGDEEPAVVFPEVFPIIAALLKGGFDITLRSANNNRIIEDAEMTHSPESPTSRSGSSSMSCIEGEPSAQGNLGTWKDYARSAAALQVVVQFLLDMHATSSSFREFASTPQIMENLLGILFPIICSSDPVSAETELMSKDSVLTFDTGEVRIESLTIHHSSMPALRAASSLSVRSAEEEEGNLSFDLPGRPRASSLRRASSYVLVTSETVKYNGSKATITPAIGTKPMGKQLASLNVGNSTTSSLLELVTAIAVEGVLGKREFTNLDFSTKLPPSFREHQIYFVTYILRNTLSHLNNALSIDRGLLYQSSRILSNLMRFSQRCTDAVFEGSWISGSSNFRLVSKRR